jgi:hypothetical protein
MTQPLQDGAARTPRPTAREAQASDFRLAGALSAGLLTLILSGGALIVPSTPWGGATSARLGEPAQTVRLREAPPSVASPAGTPATRGGTAFAATDPYPAAPARRVLAAVRPDGAPAEVAPRIVENATAETGVAGVELSTLQVGAESLDADGDGIPEQWWQANGLAPAAVGDADQDGIPNAVEFRLDSRPTTGDSNADGIADGEDDFDADGLRNSVEIAAAMAPDISDFNADGRPDGLDDADGDGLSNAMEQDLGTNLGSGDTDGDGVSDGSSDPDGDGTDTLTEAQRGTDPRVAEPVIVAPTEPQPQVEAPAEPAPAVAPVEPPPVPSPAPPEPVVVAAPEPVAIVPPVEPPVAPAPPMPEPVVAAAVEPAIIASPAEPVVIVAQSAA